MERNRYLASRKKRSEVAFAGCLPCLFLNDFPQDEWDCSHREHLAVAGREGGSEGQKVRILVGRAEGIRAFKKRSRRAVARCKPLLGGEVRFGGCFVRGLDFQNSLYPGD